MEQNAAGNGPHPQNENGTEERFDVTKQVSYGRLIYLRFLRNHAAVVAAFALVFIYLITLVCPFFAPYDPNTRFLEKVAHPPLLPTFIDAEGQFHLRPFVYATVQSRDPKTMERMYTKDTTPALSSAALCARRRVQFSVLGQRPASVRRAGFAGLSPGHRHAGP